MSAPVWTTACADWRERIVRGRSLIPCRPLFPQSAEAGLRIFKALKLVDVGDSPTFEDLDNRFILDFVEVIFGAYDPETGRRLINEFFWLISKKNAKSTMAAGIMLTALLLNWRKSCGHIILAPTVEIADNSAEPAMDMVAEDPELKTLLKIVANERLIEHRQTGAWLKVVAADEETVGGKKAACVLYDEHWLFGKRVKAGRMMREAQGGLAARPEGFVIKLSTQSNEPPAGVFKADLERFRDIRDGKLVAPKCLGILYEFPETMITAGAYRDPSNWYITNPLLDKGLDRQYLLDEWEKAQRAGAGEVADFCAKHLNVEIGISLRANRWAGADHWEACGDKNLTLDSLIAQSEICTVGIDGGGLDDLLGLAVLGRVAQAKLVERDALGPDGVKIRIQKPVKPLLHYGHLWAHREVLERRKDIASVLRDFESQGDLTFVDSLDDALEEIAELIARLDDTGLLSLDKDRPPIGIDQLGMPMLVSGLVQRGVALERFGGIPQGYKLNGAIGDVGVRLRDGLFIHGGRPFMAWSVGNAKIVQVGNAVTITKQVAGSAKIDAVMAAFDADAVMAKNPDDVRSVYDQLSDDDEAQTGDDLGKTPDELAAILRDPAHPMWEAVRERFELSLPSAREDD